MKFGEKLAGLRKKAGMSQEDLAEKLEVSRQAVSRWEAGSTLPDAVNLLKLSDLFCVSADALLRDEMPIAAAEQREEPAAPVQESMTGTAPSLQPAADRRKRDRYIAAAACCFAGALLLTAVCFGLYWITGLGKLLIVLLPPFAACMFGTGFFSVKAAKQNAGRGIEPAAPWMSTAVYAVYAALCVLSGYGAAAVQEAMRHQINLTYRATPYTCVTYAAYVLLGMLWAGEMCLAVRVRKHVMLLVRLITICVLILLGIGWAAAMLLTDSAPAWLFDAYAKGAMPVFALTTGWLIISTVWLAFRRKEKEEEKLPEPKEVREEHVSSESVPPVQADRRKRDKLILAAAAFFLAGVVFLATGWVYWNYIVGGLWLMWLHLALGAVCLFASCFCGFKLYVLLHSGNAEDKTQAQARLAMVTAVLNLISAVCFSFAGGLSDMWLYWLAAALLTVSSIGEFAHWRKLKYGK